MKCCFAFGGSFNRLGLRLAIRSLLVVFIFSEFPVGYLCAFGQTPRGVWTVDVAKDADFSKRLSLPEVSLDAPSINFVSNSQIICDFYDGEKGGYNLSMPASGYHVLEIDANEGAFGRKLNFRPVDDHSRALPTDDGGFIVFAGRELKKFSGEFTPGVTYPTPREQVGDVLDRWLVDVSPSLQTILLYYHRPGDPQARWTWLRTKDLSVAESFQSSLTAIVRAADTAALFDGVGNQQLLSSGKSTVICARCDVYFLTNDLLFVDKEKSYDIRTAEGKQQGEGKLDIQALSFTRAAHATRVAFVTGHYKGRGFPIQTHFGSIIGRIIVLDWHTNKQVAEIEVNEHVDNPSAGLTQMALALSPNGKSLAVLSHHMLTLYRLP